MKSQFEEFAESMWTSVEVVEYLHNNAGMTIDEIEELISDGDGLTNEIKKEIWNNLPVEIEYFSFGGEFYDRPIS